LTRFHQLQGFFKWRNFTGGDMHANLVSLFSLHKHKETLAS
jgi:hypothetical protein